MKYQEIKVQVSKRFDLGDMSDVWIFRREGEKHFLAHFTKQGLIEFSKIKEGEYQNDPTMRIPTLLVQDIVDAFTKEIPPTKKEAIDSELKATKYHLEDMRKIVLK